MSVTLALLVGAVEAPPAAAAATDPGLEELWEEFPLDAEPASPAPEPASTARRPRPEPAPTPAQRPAAPVTSAPSADVGRPLGTSRALVVVLAALALVLGLALATAAYGRWGPLPRLVRLRVVPAQLGGIARINPASTAQWLRAARPVASAIVPRRSVARTDDPARSAAAVVEALLRAVTSRRDPDAARRPSTMPRVAQKPDLEVLKTKVPPADVAKHPPAAVGSDVEVLKQSVSPPGASEALKSIARTDRSPAKPSPSPADASVLKEKLAATAAASPAHARELAAAPLRTPETRREPPLRPLAATAVTEPTAPARPAGETGRAGECEIRWWRGYVASQFYATFGPDDGAQLTIAASPSFRWRKSVPPPEMPPAATAFQTLMNALEQEGWTVCGRGDEWFSVRLRRRPDPDLGTRSDSNR